MNIGDVPIAEMNIDLGVKLKAIEARSGLWSGAVQSWNQGAPEKALRSVR
jgi:hypothetical protein